jgi:hypothetical protein
MLLVTHAGEVKRCDGCFSESVIGIVLEPGDDPCETERVARDARSGGWLCDPWSYRAMVPCADALREYVCGKAYGEPEKGVFDE